MTQLWNLILVNPIHALLVFLYNLSGQNLGWGIILLTIVIRVILIPVFLPSMRTMKKQRELQPQLEKIKEKYKYDKQKQAEEQMKFFKEHGLNPTSGCLSQVVMILVLFALYGVIQGFTKGSDGINTAFFYLNLGQPDPVYALPILAGLVTLISSKMMQPYVEKGEKLAKKTPDKSDDLAYNMQEQMLYLMPVMTVVITLKLPSGIALYLLVTTIFSVVQQYFVSGWGGMRPIINRLKWKN